MSERKENAKSNAKGRADYHLWCKSQRYQCELRIKNSRLETIAGEMLACVDPKTVNLEHYINGIKQERADCKAGKI